MSFRTVHRLRSFSLPADLLAVRVALGADPVYRLLTGDGLPVKEMPEIRQRAMGKVAYHIRAGKHDVTAYDWEQYLKSAKMS